ncbi:MAG: exosome complex RNA-binding protein Csl4 [Candidatus Bathyarchaeaceae archaeon]
MSKSERKSGQFVVPGDRLGVIEEFTPGSGTYVEHGTIHSKTTGRTLMDTLNKKVSVYPLVQAASVPRVGSIVSGQVLDVKSKTAVLRILQVGKKSLSGFFTGLLHISDVSPSYVETMFDVCKTGDIMRAKLISDKNRTFYLSTAEKNLGIIYAFCSQCGHVLLSSRQRLRCPRCGNIEKRKVTPDYGEEAT